MNKKIVGVIVLVVLILAIIGIKFFTTSKVDTDVIPEENLVTVKVAVGGGKEDFLKDEKVVDIMRNKYGLNVIYDNWSNGKMIKEPLVRKEDGSEYDVMFCSDQRFYDYYKLKPDPAKGEAKRYYVKDGGLTLNTPIVIYSWDTVVDALVKEGIVTERDNVFYITDMNKLIDYILQGKKWNEIGLDMLYGHINIGSTDPVTSSPGATYYGLLLSVMCNGDVNDQTMQENLPKLKEFYNKSGYMNNTPADLFDKYLKTGMGGAPMIVDYEKSLVEFATKNPNGFNQVKDHIRVLYPQPTIWNSHCISTFTDAGEKYRLVFEDPEIQQIAWEKYGFRTGVIGGNYDVSKIGIKGVPQAITSTVTSLKMSMYESLIDYLKIK